MTTGPARLLIHEKPPNRFPRILPHHTILQTACEFPDRTSAIRKVYRHRSSRLGACATYPLYLVRQSGYRGGSHLRRAQASCTSLNYPWFQPCRQLAIDGCLVTLELQISRRNLRRSNVSHLPRCRVSTLLQHLGAWNSSSAATQLDAVGASIASEVSAFLIQFPNYSASIRKRSTRQNYRSTASGCRRSTSPWHLLRDPHLIADNVHIEWIPRGSNRLDIPEVKWDAASVLEMSSLAGLDDHAAGGILPMGEREVWMSKKRTGRRCNNLRRR